MSSAEFWSSLSKLQNMQSKLQPPQPWKVILQPARKKKFFGISHIKLHTWKNNLGYFGLFWILRQLWLTRLFNNVAKNKEIRREVVKQRQLQKLTHSWRHFLLCIPRVSSCFENHKMEIPIWWLCTFRQRIKSFQHPTNQQYLSRKSTLPSHVLTCDDRSPELLYIYDLKRIIHNHPPLSFCPAWPISRFQKEGAGINCVKALLCHNKRTWC